MDSIRSGLFGLEILVRDEPGDISDQEGSTYSALQTSDVEISGVNYQFVVAPPLGTPFALRALLPSRNRYECVFNVNGVDLRSGAPAHPNLHGFVMEQGSDIVCCYDSIGAGQSRPLLVDASFDGSHVGSSKTFGAPTVTLTIFREATQLTSEPSLDCQAESLFCPLPDWQRGEQIGEYSIVFGTYGQLVRSGFIYNRPVRAGDDDPGERFLAEAFGWKGGRTRDKRQR